MEQEDHKACNDTRARGAQDKWNTRRVNTRKEKTKYKDKNETTGFTRK